MDHIITFEEGSQIITKGVPDGVHGWGKLLDDDDRGLIEPQLPRLDLVNSELIDYYKPSFVDVVDASAFNPSKLIPFRLYENISESESTVTVDNTKDLTDTPLNWVCTVVACYQPDKTEDNDPSVETEVVSFGETGGFNGNDEFSAIYMEGCREAYSLNFESQDETGFPTRRSQYKRYITAITAHEMGHHPGTQGGSDDHAEGGLMASGLGGISIFTFAGAKFSPKTINRFRKCKRWAE